MSEKALITKYKRIKTYGTRISLNDGSREIARAYLYILHNDLHPEPLGYLEDVFVAEDLRRKGIGKDLLSIVVEEAKKLKCYKLIATSRYERSYVHKYYEDSGFKDWGREYRLDIELSHLAANNER